MKKNLLIILQVKKEFLLALHFQEQQQIGL